MSKLLWVNYFIICFEWVKSFIMTSKRINYFIICFKSAFVCIIYFKWANYFIICHKRVKYFIICFKGACCCITCFKWADHFIICSNSANYLIICSCLFFLVSCLITMAGYGYIKYINLFNWCIIAENLGIVIADFLALISIGF